MKLDGQTQLNLRILASAKSSIASEHVCPKKSDGMELCKAKRNGAHDFELPIIRDWFLSNVRTFDFVVFEFNFGEKHTQRNCHHRICQFLHSKPELLRFNVFATAIKSLEAVW